MGIHNTVVEYVMGIYIGCLTCVLYHFTKLTFQVFSLFRFATFMLLDFLHAWYYLCYGINLRLSTR